MGTFRRGAKNKLKFFAALQDCTRLSLQGSPSMGPLINSERTASSRDVVRPNFRLPTNHWIESESGVECEYVPFVPVIVSV